MLSSRELFMFFELCREEDGLSLLKILADFLWLKLCLFEDRLIKPGYLSAELKFSELNIFSMPCFSAFSLRSTSC